MSLETFLLKVKSNETLSFDETMEIITQHYDYTPAEFTNGSGEDSLVNAAGTNEGSCKIFAFSLLNELNQQQTLSLFGDFYSKEVLQDPLGNSHQNIRRFMRDSWDGINFSQPALVLKI
jgi:hypothetical protein